MKMNCALCGRKMAQAAVFIGGLAIGPKCSRRAGLMPLAAKRAGSVRPGPAFRSHATRQEADQLDLFEEVAHG
jgi:hypothetical protein